MWMMCLGGLGGRSGELGCWGAGESDEVGLRSDGEEVEQSWEESREMGRWRCSRERMPSHQTSLTATEWLEACRWMELAGP